MAQEATDIFETLSYYCDSASTTSEISFIQSSEGDLDEMSQGDEFVVSDGEHSAYTEGSSADDNDPFEDPDLEHEGAAEAGHKFPISAIAQRVTNRDGVLVTQYLVLWQSWEDSIPKVHEVKSMGLDNKKENE